MLRGEREREWAKKELVFLFFSIQFRKAFRQMFLLFVIIAHISLTDYTWHLLLLSAIILCPFAVRSPSWSDSSKTNHGQNANNVMKWMKNKNEQKYEYKYKNVLVLWPFFSWFVFSSSFTHSLIGRRVIFTKQYRTTWNYSKHAGDNAKKAMPSADKMTNKSLLCEEKTIQNWFTIQFHWRPARVRTHPQHTHTILHLNPSMSSVSSISSICYSCTALV